MYEGSHAAKNMDSGLQQISDIRVLLMVNSYRLRDIFVYRDWKSPFSSTVFWL